jgi:acetyl-CoA carboxylase carboxyltransferase component
LNDSIPELNKSVTLANLLKVFDEGSAIELGASYCPQIKCYLGRIGGIAVACVFFDNKDGVKLSASKIRKINDLAQLACFYNLPFINFVNTLGICPCKEVNDSPVLKEIGSFVNIINSMDAPKLAVVCDKAIGLGYTLFAAKSLGYDFTCAFANARIGLFDGAQGAEIEYSGEKNVDKQKLIERYNDEKADPVNAAKGGYIDNIIEPEFVRQYLIASLQMYVM